MSDDLPREQDDQVEDENEEINDQLDDLFNPFDEMEPDVQNIPKKSNFRRKYLDPKYLWEKCKEYFDECDQAGRVYTVPELALHLGFVSRQAIFLYEKRGDNCSKVIRAAKLKIEGQRNRQVVEGQGYMAGRIFDLKVNFGYNDQPDAVSKDGGDQPSTQINVQNNYTLPPQPQSLEEWTNWYRSQMKSTNQQQKIEPTPSDQDGDDSDETIDVSPSVRDSMREDD